MATTVEVQPTSGPMGDAFDILVTEAPVSGGRPPHRTDDLCSLSIEGPMGTGVGFTINKPDQRVRFNSDLVNPEEVGEWAVKLFRWDDFTKPNRDELVLASAILNIVPAA